MFSCSLSIASLNCYSRVSTAVRRLSMCIRPHPLFTIEDDVYIEAIEVQISEQGGFRVQGCLMYQLLQGKICSQKKCSEYLWSCSQYRGIQNRRFHCIVSMASATIPKSYYNCCFSCCVQYLKKLLFQLLCIIQFLCKLLQLHPWLKLLHVN